MKLLRFGDTGSEHPGVLDDQGNIRDLTEVVDDIGGDVLGPSGLSSFREVDLASLPLIDENIRLGACVAQAGKFICIGMNYLDHAAEQGLTISEEPTIFMKATSAICGPNDDTEIPRKSKKTDWEVELGVVIGTEAKYVDEDEALNHVAGYCVINDLSEREFQLEREGQWVKGKSCDTFGPIGPYLVTADEIPDPQKLDLWLDVNGHRYQNSNTRQMAFNVKYLVSYISQFMSLQPGDIISTGTPGGVGIFLPEPKFLVPGDVMELGIEGLGIQRQRVVAG